MTATSSFTTDDLTVASTPEQDGPGRFVLRVPDGWQQGRGAFGGLLLAALTRAMEATEPEKDRKLRSFNGEIAGPVLPGEATIEVTAVRNGGSLSAWNATLHQRGRGLVRASAVLARSRGTDPETFHVKAPSIPPFKDVPVVALDRFPFAPVFAQHVEFRIFGPRPFRGGSEPLSEGWIRLKRAPPSVGAPEIVALADAFYPAAFAVVPAPRPAGTVAFGLQSFLPETPLDPAEPLYHRGRTIAESGGYMAEARELWTQDGRLVALNQQTIAWIR